MYFAIKKKHKQTPNLNQYLPNIKYSLSLSLLSSFPSLYISLFANDEKKFVQTNLLILKLFLSIDQMGFEPHSKFK